eukprot:gb/GECG01014521.1/.p1 GENE.gb/GECG01014521.1/~~gb/GECG01014521.1/.p1  ORF type:complete len:531 (+),score=49.42 gb/GECG01014521.1/:1-1593(+)
MDFLSFPTRASIHKTNSCSARLTRRMHRIHIYENGTRMTIIPSFHRRLQYAGGMLQAGGTTAQFRDPCTAWWQSEKQRWFISFAATIDQKAQIVLYSSPDFTHWKYEGVLFSSTSPFVRNINIWECPDFFNTSTEDAGSSPGGAKALKYSEKVLSQTPQSQDWILLGNYNVSTQVFQPASSPSLYDYGTWYASKSFYDPVNRERVLWGWIPEDGPLDGRDWAGTQSVPRQLGADYRLGIVTAQPVSALEQLRSSVVVSDSGIKIFANETKSFDVAIGQQFDMHSWFDISQLHSLGRWYEFGIVLRASSDATTFTRVAVTHTAGSGVEVETDRPGGDFRDILYAREHSNNIKNCSEECQFDPSCLAWTYVPAGAPDDDDPNGLPRCSLKWYVPRAHDNPDCVSGVVASSTLFVDRSHSGGNGNKTRQGGRLPMKTGETLVDLRVLSDHSVIEVFGQRGRARIASRIYPQDPEAVNGGLFLNTGSTAEGIGAWVPRPETKSLNTAGPVARDETDYLIVKEVKVYSMSSVWTD